MIPQPPIELIFRDGPQVVPDHVAKLIAMAGLDTELYTREEAVELTNQTLVRNHLNEVQQRIIGQSLGGRLF